MSFVSFLFQLRGRTRSLWGLISWWRSRVFPITPSTNRKAAEHSWERIHCLTNQRAERCLMVPRSSHVFCTMCPNKVLQPELADFPGLPLVFPVFLWFSRTSHRHTAAVFRSQAPVTQFPPLSGRSTNRSVFDCTWVFTHARCAAVNTRDGGEGKKKKKKRWEGWPQRRGGYVYLYTKWCMRRPRTTQLDPVSVNTVTPPSDTHEHSRGNQLAPPTLFFFFFLFTPLLSSSTPFALSRFIAFLGLSIS